MASEKTVHTKEKIFNAAVKVFAQKGFSAATTSEIAKEAGIAEGTIFRYYKTKKDILRGVMLQYVENFEEILDLESVEKLINENTDKSIEEVLKMVAMNRYKVFEKWHSMVMVIMYEMQFHEDIKKIYLDKVMEKENKLAELFIEKIKYDNQYKDINYKSARRIFQSMVLGLFHVNQEFEKDITLSIEEEIDIIIDVFFNGIRKK